MGDYIKRSDALRPFVFASDGTKYLLHDCDNFPVQIQLKDVQRTLRKIPAADVRENVHGKWLRHNDNPFVKPCCSVWYVFLPNAQAYGAFRNRCEDEGAPAPERYELGCWMFDDVDCEWSTFVEMEEKLSKRLIELEQLRGILTGESS